MLFDEPDKFNFFDGLVCPEGVFKTEQHIVYKPDIRQHITKNNVKKGEWKEHTDIDRLSKLVFEAFQDQYDSDNVFKMGKVQDGCMIPLIRNKPSLCPISSKHHDSDNAYIFIAPDRNAYFKCHRGCANNNGSKSIFIK
jgi:hypothetical protein